MLRVSLPFLAGFLVSYVFRSINALLGPRLAVEFSLSASQLGLLTGSYFLAFIVVQLPLGMLLDRYGPRRVNGVLFVAACAGGLLFAGARDFGDLLAARTLFGLGVSAALMGAMQAYVLWYPRERLAVQISVVYATGGVGALLTSFPLAWLLGFTGWREVFTGLALASLGVTAAMFLWVPERTAPRRPLDLRSQFAGLAAVLADPGLRRVAVAVTTGQFVVGPLINLWVSTWLRDVAGFGERAVAWMLAANAVAMIVGYLVYGRLADAMVRRGGTEFRVYAGSLAATLVMLAPLALAGMLGTVPPWVAVLLWPAFTACGMGAAVAFSIGNRRFPPEYAGRVSTVLNLFTLIAMFIGQWAVGAVIGLFPGSAAGYAPEAYVVALGAQWLLLAAALAWLWSGRRLFEPRGEAAPST